MNRTARLALGSLLLATSTGGCDFLTEFWGSPDDLTRIRIPITFEVPQALPIVLPSGQQVEAIPADAEGNRSLTTCPDSTTLDPSCLPPVYVPELDLVELDSSGQLGQYRDVIESIEIVGVTMNVVNNGLNVEMQPIDLRVGPVSATFAQATSAATTPIVSPGFVGEAEAVVDDGNRDAVGAILAGLEFGMGMGTSLFIPNGVEPNGGQATVRLTLALEVTVNPL